MLPAETNKIQAIKKCKICGTCGTCDKNYNFFLMKAIN